MFRMERFPKLWSRVQKPRLFRDLKPTFKRGTLRNLTRRTGNYIFLTKVLSAVIVTKRCHAYSALWKSKVKKRTRKTWGNTC